jgi:hypothetical protein
MWLLISDYVVIVNGSVVGDNHKAVIVAITNNGSDYHQPKVVILKGGDHSPLNFRW